MSTIQERKERIKEKRDKWSARLQKIEVHERKLEHQKDTRRKILLGAYCLEAFKQDSTLTLAGKAGVLKILDGYLTRDYDRSLFDLPPLAHPENKETPVKHPKVGE